jgi:hypothetical protein
MRHNLRAVIVERFGTQLRCAEQTGIHITRLNRIIRGWIEPTLIERERLASSLGADAQWLFSTVTRIPAPAPLGNADAPRAPFACAGKEA